MQNPGEEIVGEYLKVILGCDFVQYNFYTPDVHGEIDVVGINVEKRIIYICEVATHLVTGMQYVKNRQPDNINRFVSKFEKNIRYANIYFDDYEKHFMLWSPIVKRRGENPIYNQFEHLKKIAEILNERYGVKLETVVNESYANALQNLRKYAAKETKELKSPILRLMQIEEKLLKHISNLHRSL
jgi:hypothetical protein